MMSDDRPAHAARSRRTLPQGSAWGRPGGDWAGMRPVIDNPLTWSLPIARFSGLTVRVHIIFIAFVIMQLAWSLVPTHLSIVDFKLAAMLMGVLLLTVLAHELGHVLICRMAEGTADEILLWPLGGLAACHPPNTPSAHLWTAMGGLLVNLTIFVLSAPILMLLTRDWNVVIPSPLEPLAYISDPLLARTFPALALYMLHSINVTLILFNLLPMFPLDGGRILHAILWKHRGWSGAMRTAVRVGFVVGLALAAFGAITAAWHAVAVAILGLITCYQTDRQLAFGDSLLEFESDQHAIASSWEPDPLDENDADADADAELDEHSNAPDADAPDAPDAQSSSAPHIDRILQKIAQSGMESLTSEERMMLQKETDRRRSAP